MKEMDLILTALSEWSPAHYGGFRVNPDAPVIDANNVTVIFNGHKGQILDFARVQECFTVETAVKACSLSDGQADSCPAIQHGGRFQPDRCSRPCEHSKYKIRSETETILVSVKIIRDEHDMEKAIRTPLPGRILYYAMPETVCKKAENRIPRGVGILEIEGLPDSATISCRREAEPRALNQETQKWLLYSIAQKNQAQLLDQIKTMQKELPF